VGNGEDKVFGTMNSFVMSASGINGSDLGSLVTDCDVKIAGNLILAGHGNGDQLYGTMETLELDAIGGGNGNQGQTTFATVGGYNGSGGNTFTIGSMICGQLEGNTVIAGNGNDDEVFGTLGVLNLNANVPTSVIGGSDGGSNTFNFGGNWLEAGNGCGDQLFGTMQAIDLSALAGDLIGGYIGGSNSFDMGANFLLTGCGSGDELFGTAQSIELIATAISQSSYIGGALGGNDSFIFGTMDCGNLDGNTLIAGNGNDDSLFGSLQTLELSATAGSLIGEVTSPSTSNFVSFTFGNNYVAAGNGNGDLLVGAVDQLQLTQESGSFIGGVTITFGVDTIHAGNGATTLVGELEDVILGDGYTLPEFLTNNTVISGENTFDLGRGVDTLVFDVGIDAGVNLVNAWNVNKNILEFNNAISLADLESRATLSSDGHGGTLVSITTAPGDVHNINGGSIDFEGVAYHTGATLLDLVHGNAAHLIVHA